MQDLATAKAEAQRALLDLAREASLTATTAPSLYV
jgi:hypothetical protein